MDRRHRHKPRSVSRSRSRERRSPDRRSRHHSRSPSYRSRSPDHRRRRHHEGRPRSPETRAERDYEGRHRRPDRSHGQHRHREADEEDRYERQRHAAPGPRSREALSEEPPPVGSIHRARVQSVRPFGLFVAFSGHRRHGLVHSSQVAADVHFSREDDDQDKVKAMEFFAPQGSEVWVKVVEVRQEGADVKVGASMKAVSQEDGTDLDPQNLAAQRGGPGGGGGHGSLSEEAPEVGSIHRATVAKVAPYGMFVKLPGFKKNGLVHAFQVSDHLEIPRDDSDEQKVEALASVVAEGEQAWVKVVEVQQDDRGPKIGCSIKLVSQKDGTDLDPNFLKYQPRGDREGAAQGRKPAGANAAAVQSGTIDWGYLKGGDKAYQGAGQYDILVDEPGQDRSAPAAAAPSRAADVAPAGRGRGSVLPAWMTSGAAAATAPGAPAGNGAAAIGSVEEAVAILEKYGKRGSKKDKKDRKSKKHKKDKGDKHKKSKHKHKLKDGGSD